MSINPDKPPLVRGWRKNILISIAFSLLVAFPFSEPAEGEVEVMIPETEPEEIPLITQENSLLGLSSHLTPEKDEEKILFRRWVIVTGYSSTPDQCDEDPWITASGSPVHQGIIAANFLSFGTRVRMPEIYEEEVFIVKDRMNPRVGSHIDIWFPTRWQALNFGTTTTYIEILAPEQNSFSAL